MGGTSAQSGGALSAGGSVQGGSPGSGGVGTGGANTALGGANPTGGMPSMGGSKATGGNAATGGLASVGGTTASGGTTATGGSTTSGGNTSGGMLATGGAIAIGGTQAAGGSNTGGSTGGSIATGGSKTTGGSAATGGSKATGGVTAAGGTKATGGSSSSSNTPITVWLAGDSTVQPCTTACPCGWGSQFDPYFNSNVTVNNSAVGGRSIQTWLYEGNVSSTIGSDGECVLTSTTYNARWTNMLNSMKAGDYLMIDFGINDGDSTCPRHVGSARFQTLLGVMAQAAKAKGAIPIFLTPTDAITCSGNTVTENRGFLTDIKTAATANSVTVIDLNQLTMSLYASLGFCPNAGDYTSTTSALGLFFCDDHTHFEAAGAKQVAGLVAKALRTQGIALASYLL